MHILTEWQIQSWIDRAVNNKAEKYEIHKINSDVDSLECTVRKLSSQIDGLSYELQTCKNELNDIKERQTAE